MTPSPDDDTREHPDPSGHPAPQPATPHATPHTVPPPPFAPPPPGPYGPGYQYPQSQMPAAEEKNWTLLAHLGPLIGSFVAPGVASFIPLGVLLIKGEQSPAVRAHAVEALNFQLSYLIYALAAFVLCFVLIGFLLLPIVGLTWFILTIVGSVKASSGDLYRYPTTIRMVT